MDDRNGIEDFGKDQQDWPKTFLVLPNGTPGHDTFNRVFQRLDPKAFSEVFLAWVRGESARRSP